MSAFSVIKYVRGYVYVHLTGYATERFLNLCGNHNILIWNLKPVKDGYEFCISTDGYKQLKPLLKKTKTRARILKKTGLPFQLFRYRRHKFFAVGILMFLFLLFYCSGFVWNIEVDGNSYLSEQTVLAFLKEKHATYGSQIRTIDCEQLEDAIRTQFPDVIWTSVRIYGTKMTVEIQENLLGGVRDVDHSDTDSISDIIAAKDGEILSVITRTGTPLVTEHTSVKKGDLLVRGSVAITNDDGEVTEYLYPGADADILAKTVYSYRDEIPVSCQEREKTGNQKTRYGIRFFQETLWDPFFQNPFPASYRIEEQRQFHFSDSFYLPLFLVTDRYEEYIWQEKSRSEETIKALAKAHFSQYLANLEEKGIQILEKDVMIEKLNQKYVVSGTVEVCESIVAFQPTEIFEKTSEERQTDNESD